MSSPSKKSSKKSQSFNERLYNAVIACDKDEVKRLIDAKADVNWTNPKISGNTPLFTAIEINCPIEIVEMLIAAGADVNKVNNDGETPLSKAIQNGNPIIVKRLIDAGIDVKKKDTTGNSYIHYAACEETPGITPNYLIIINLILDNNEDINVENADKSTPLHLAAALGNTDVASLLIERGADITKQNNDKMTPLHMAALSGSYNIADLLISNLRLRTDFHDILNTKNYQGMTPLHIAVETANNGDQEAKIRRELLTRQLIRYANIEITDTEENTPLHVACVNGHTQIAELLLNKGDVIDKLNNIEPGYIRYIDRQNKDGNTPLDIAAKYHKKNITELLRSRGAITNKSGKTATTVASASGKTATNPAGGNRKTRGKRITGKKTRSNRR